MVDWINGPATYLPGVDRFGAPSAEMVGLNVGYYGDARLGSPSVGELFTGHIVVGAGFPARGGVVVDQLGVRLPPGVSFSPQPPGIRCYSQDRQRGTYLDSTGDPSAGCPVFPPGRLTNGFADLGRRDLPQGYLFEVQFDLVSQVPLAGALLEGYVRTDWGELTCQVPLDVAATPVSAPASGRLQARVVPDVLPLNALTAFTVRSQDTGNGRPVQGLVTIDNYPPGWSLPQPLPLILPTNTPVTLTLKAGGGIPASVNLDRFPSPFLPYSGPYRPLHPPRARVTAPGYDADRNMAVPLRFFGVPLDTGKFEVTVVPRYLQTGVVRTFTIVSRDTGSHWPVQGLATFAYHPYDGAPQSFPLVV